MLPQNASFPLHTELLTLLSTSNPTRRYEFQCVLQITGTDAKTNVAAAFAASEKGSSFQAAAKAFGISAKDGFETAFNMACIKLQTGELKEAQELLLLGLRSGDYLLLD